MNNNLNCISTSHSLARELLNRPDGFITVTIGEKEYVIKNIKRIPSHANYDDISMYLILNLDECGTGNIRR